MGALSIVLLQRDKVVAARLGAAAAVAGAFLALLFLGAYRGSAQRAPGANAAAPPADFATSAVRNIAMSAAGLGLGLIAVSRARRA
jgi:hypothetical protein